MLFPADWSDISYLKHGSATQKRAWEVLTAANLLERLQPYDPILTGTVPLGIDLPDSDLDLICEVYDLDGFAAVMRAWFGLRPGFSLRSRDYQGLPACICGFTVAGVEVEIFGQPRSTRLQNAYVHMVVEARLLAAAGPAAAAAIRALKAEGLKTEPAFASYFGLSGDPYQALLDLATADDAELRSRVGL